MLNHRHLFFTPAEAAELAAGGVATTLAGSRKEGNDDLRLLGVYKAKGAPVQRKPLKHTDYEVLNEFWEVDYEGVKEDARNNATTLEGLEL
ncbi:hypothetical protein Tco_1068256 [Tanacetum coccineum]|uniref:Uncharacterized protein n=1 Tax=Tanacetum coccineum TaxID=301880 RepID=A0ABQ5HG25_9ASTR